jgi:rhodanese-related sulfurtransferase
MSSPYSKIVKKKYDSISAEAAYEQQRNGVLMVDVRDEQEFMAGHPRGARHIPVRELPHRLSELSADQPVLLISDQNARAHAAAELLTASGLVASTVEGGIREWRAKGHPIEM